MYNYPDKPKEEDATPEILEKALHVVKVDLNIESNTKKHHTDKYKRTKNRKKADGTVLEPELVVRRGQEFIVTVTLSGEYSVAKNDMELEFAMGRVYS